MHERIPARDLMPDETCTEPAKARTDATLSDTVGDRIPVGTQFCTAIGYHGTYEYVGRVMRPSTRHHIYQFRPINADQPVTSNYSLYHSALKRFPALSQYTAEVKEREAEGWKEAAIAWEVCASLHREYCRGKDALFTTRQADFVRHAEVARQMYLLTKERK